MVLLGTGDVREKKYGEKPRGQFGAEGIHAPCRNRAGRAERVCPTANGWPTLKAGDRLCPLTVSRTQHGVTDFDLRRPTLKIFSQKRSPA